MAFSLQGALGTSNSKTANQTTLTLTLNTGGGTLPSGDIILVFVVKDNTATTGGATTQVTVSDPLGNTYTRLGEINVGASAQAGCCLAVFYTAITTAVPNSTILTATLGGTTNSNDASAMSAYWVKPTAGLASHMRIGTLYSESVLNTTNPANVAFPSPAFTDSGLSHLFVDVLALEADATESSPTPTGMSLYGGISTGTTGSTPATNVRLVVAMQVSAASLTITNDWNFSTARDICRLGISFEEVAHTGALMPADTLTLSDEIEFGGSAVTPKLNASDSITLSDSIQATLAISIGESLTLVDDELTPTYSIHVQANDSICDIFFLDAFAFDLAEYIVVDIPLTLSDALALSDSAQAGITATYLSVSDQLTLSDASAFFKTDAKALADTLALTDSIQRSAVLYSSISDTLFLADSVQADIQEKTKALSDTLSLIDSLTYDLGTGFVALSYAVSDALVLDDADVIETGVSAWQVFISEHLCDLTDSIQAGHGVSFSEAITLADAESHLSASEIALSDALTLADSFQADVPQKTLALSDALTLNDTFNYSAGGDLTRSFAESLTLTESVATFGVGATLLTDTLALADALARTLSNAKPLTDALALSDAAALRQNFLYTASDSLTLSDNANAGIHELTHAFSDALNLNDTLNYTVGGSPDLTRSFSDSLSLADGAALPSANFYLGVSEHLCFLTDSLSYTKTDTYLPRNFTDSLALSDSVSMFATVSVSLSDQLAFTDSIKTLGVGAIQFTETLTLVDFVRAEIREKQLALGDTITLSDTLTYSGGGIFSYGFADPLTLTDTISVRLATSLALNDTVSLTDALSVGYGLKLGDQLALLDAWQGSQFIELSLEDSLLLKDKFSFFKSVEGIIPAGRIYCIGMDNRRLEIMHENRVIFVHQIGRIVYIDREGNICCD